jgi:serine/threonine-protein kinase
MPANPSVNDPPGEPTAAQDAKTGTIEFEIRPWAIVYLEGKKLGRAPPLGLVDIPPGIYTVKFVNKKLRKTVARPIEVKAGQTVFVRVDLLHEEAPAP